MKKCNNLKNQWCRDTEDIAHFSDPDSYGLNVSAVVKLKNGDRGFGMLIRQRNPETGKKGFAWLNFCPFCGADISKRTEKKK